jgi:predicted alpha/beta hydrolase
MTLIVRVRSFVCQTTPRFPNDFQANPVFDSSNTDHPVILAAATGVPASFYFDFASYLSELGCAVLLFDYRYLGKSWPRAKELKTREDKIEALRSAKDVKISVHWVRDFEASLRFLLEKFGVRRKVVVVGHSVGGHLLPLLSQDLLDKVERTIWVVRHFFRSLDR